MEMIAVVLLSIARIGLPVVAIMGLSYLVFRWLGESPLKKSVAKQATVPRAAVSGPSPVAKVLAAGSVPHCWDVHHCTEAMKAKCPAVARPELPCWLAVQMKSGHLRPNCFECDFYKSPALRA